MKFLTMALIFFLVSGCGTFRSSKDSDWVKNERAAGRDPIHIRSCGPDAVYDALHYIHRNIRWVKDPFSRKEISIIIGGPYNSGILASDLDKKSTYFYEPSPSEIILKAKKIKKICDKFNVPLKAAALQFGLNHPSVVSTIPGPRNPEEIVENLEMLSYKIDPKLWVDLEENKLIP